MSEKIYQFDKSLLNTMISPKHETLDEKGEKVTYRLVKGDSELILKKQRDTAEPISFRVYNTIIPIKDLTTQKWLESKPWFGRLCKIYDPVTENKASVQNVMDNLKTVMKVMELSDYELLGLGYQEFGQRALDMVKSQNGDYSGLKLELSAIANTNPARIEERLSENNGTYTWFGLAFAKNIIKEDESGTVISWGGENGAKIMTVVPGVKPLDAIVEFSTTTEGASVKQLIGQKMLNEVAEKESVKNSPETTSKINTEVFEGEYPEQLKDMKTYAAEKGYSVDEYAEINRKEKMIEYLDGKKELAKTEE